MQIFVKLLSGKTHTLRVENNTTVAEILRMLEDECGCASPHLNLNHGMIGCLDYNLNATVEQLRITKEQTLHAYGRSCPRLYVKWQGEWLRSKEYNTFECFWYELTRGNLCKRKANPSDTQHEYATTENLVVYHLQKIVAKFLLLDVTEIALSTFKSPTVILESNMLLSTLDSNAFIAHLRVPSPNVVVQRQMVIAQDCE